MTTTWNEIENMSEEEYKSFCLKEAENQVRKMSRTEHITAALRTLYWLSPVGFIFSNDMSMKSYRLILHTLCFDSQTRSGLNSN